MTVAKQQTFRQAARRAVAGRQGAQDGERDLTHDGLALELGDHWSDARHVAAWGQWLFYHTGIWRTDDVLEHMTRCREFLREKAEELESWAAKKAAELGDDAQVEKIRRRVAGQVTTLKSAHTVAQVVGLARSNVTQAATVDQWDRDLLQIGTPADTSEKGTS